MNEALQTRVWFSIMFTANVAHILKLIHNVWQNHKNNFSRNLTELRVDAGRNGLYKTLVMVLFSMPCLRHLQGHN